MADLVKLEAEVPTALPDSGYMIVYYKMVNGRIVKEAKKNDGTVITIAKEEEAE